MQFKKLFLLLISMFVLILVGCSKEDNPVTTTTTGVDPSTAPKASIDRFSTDAGTLFVRDGTNGLPDANAPINFDQAPFITQGFGPSGEVVKYYNFDVMQAESAPIYVLFKQGSSTPVANQLNIVDVIPGDAGYNDFWNVNKVTVPADYIANVVTSYDEIVSKGYAIEKTTTLVNCPIVPNGSTASLRFGGSGDTGLSMGWYKGKVVFYFNFAEAALTSTVPPTGFPEVPLSDILVSFNINPGQPGGGPPSGFKTEGSTAQTHNCVETIPTSTGYSPFWDVDVYDNADFDNVFDYSLAMNANILAQGVATVNCPIVSVAMGNLPIDPNTAPRVSVDRFSDAAATLFKRSENSSLPGPNMPINFDQVPFITKGLSPTGGTVQYYNFDVMAEESAPIYVLFKDGESTPVPDQINIVGVIPGEAGYNDFWNVKKVTVPSYYRANTVTSVDELMAMGYTIENTDIIVNCPIVPEGSTASLRYNSGDTGLTMGWYEDQVVFYFNFAEAAITGTPNLPGNPLVPLADILVCFNINPGMTGGGPPSGFKTETGTDQTHNVVSTIPTDTGYSPFWDVDVYDNADFDSVMDWTTATQATLLASGVAKVNCPIVSVN
jgi:hypothetical protein